jgi:hypothetical protein
LGRIGDGSGLGLVLPDDGGELKHLSEFDIMRLELIVMGLSTGKHILEYYCAWMKRNAVMTSRGLRKARDGQRVQIVGEVAAHQAPPARGYHFITRMDQDYEMMKVIVSPRVYGISSTFFIMRRFRSSPGAYSEKGMSPTSCVNRHPHYLYSKKNSAN